MERRGAVHEGVGGCARLAKKARRGAWRPANRNDKGDVGGTGKGGRAVSVLVDRRSKNCCLPQTTQVLEGKGVRGISPYYSFGTDMQPARFV